MEHTYFHGDSAEYTGKCSIDFGQAFYQIKILSGHLKDQLRYTPMPDSDHILKQGEDLTQDQMDRMQSGEIFTLIDNKGYLYSNVTRDYYGKIREYKIEGKTYCSTNGSTNEVIKCR